MTRTQEDAHEFVKWANSILRKAGIGTHNCGTPWLYYDSEDATVTLNDYNDATPIHAWERLSEFDIRQEAESWISAFEGDIERDEQRERDYAAEIESYL